MEWCHKECETKAQMYEIDPKFEGICHEGCKDDNCNLEHEDFGS